MKMLIEKIRQEAKHLGKGILKVDSFMNHQIDPVLMEGIGKEFAEKFAHTKPTRILTAETSGIAPALAAAMMLKVPLVFARKKQPITMAGEPFKEKAISPTKGGEVELIVSPEYLKAEDRVLILDDFLASAQTIQALAKLVTKSGATLVGIGAVIEKTYSGGRGKLTGIDVPVHSLAVIEKIDGDEIIFADSAAVAH